ncbi:MAG: DUF4278 domain-containing protein [Leptolyngbyaceae cyanobacterium RU_5_1]|nr:DUF4278 domain-containing protein [Leptolyngbyaceae cyanobacterium RU_5_1]
MKLTYRGISYDYNPANTFETEASGSVANLRQRGAIHRRSEVEKAERLEAIFVYRGQVYNRKSVVQPVALASTETSVENKARLLTINQNRSVRNRQHSMLTRSAAEVGLCY